MTLKEFIGSKTGTKTTVLSIVLFIVFAILAAGSAPEENIDSNNNKIRAYAFAREYVKNRLLSPRTAKFLPYSEEQVGNRGGGVYEVLLTVDSQNAFGAMIRKNWVVNIKIEADGYRILQAQEL